MLEERIVHKETVKGRPTIADRKLLATLILEAESLTPGKLDQLRQIMKPFYRDPGSQFE